MFLTKRGRVIPCITTIDFMYSSMAGNIFLHNFLSHFGDLRSEPFHACVAVSWSLFADSGLTDRHSIPAAPKHAKQDIIKET